jgi:phosphoribosyl-dephospho-CoA transferase
MLPRHNLVWLSDDGWQAVLGEAANDAATSIAAWARAGHPAVVRRAEPDGGDSIVFAGIALPPDANGTKKRIPLRIPWAHVSIVAAPLHLDEVVAAMPPTWQPALVRLCAEAQRQQISLQVYGSAALQGITGMRYVTPSSDIDLLLHPATHAELHAGLLLMAEHARILPLDGEVVFPDGSAVAWKEWITAIAAPGNPRVLVKDNRRVRLMNTKDLLCTLEDESCTSH